MDRFSEIVEFLDHDSKKRIIVEPPERYEVVRDHVFDIIDENLPGVIIKAGLGDGRLLLDIAGKSEKVYILAVEPSWERITSFMEENRDKPGFDRVRIINGDFHEFPVDYYAADFFIVIDHLDIFDISRCIDQFKISMTFDAVLLYGGVVLHDDDVEGVYDDYMRLLLPLHNDYYLEGDLKTFLDLKDFKYIRGASLDFPMNNNELREHVRKYHDHNAAEVEDFYTSHEREFRELYNLDDAGNLQERFFLGTFRRVMPETGDKIV
ncbi:MAG TPA: hypothetical protein PK200_07280 [Spirochaetota bacterium]|nr:hypothetical protein [Spirochaetota bacterium]HQP48240.1 hypothetical protein [Spirochaetota bacterium]